MAQTYWGDSWGYSVKIIDLRVLPSNCKYSKLLACFSSGERKQVFSREKWAGNYPLITGHLLLFGAHYLRMRAVLVHWAEASLAALLSIPQGEEGISFNTAYGYSEAWNGIKAFCLECKGPWGFNRAEAWSTCPAINVQQLVQDPCTKSPGLITWDEKQPLSCNLAHKTHQNSSSIALFFFFLLRGKEDTCHRYSSQFCAPGRTAYPDLCGGRSVLNCRRAWGGEAEGPQVSVRREGSSSRFGEGRRKKTVCVAQTLCVGFWLPMFCTWPVDCLCHRWGACLDLAGLPNFTNPEILFCRLTQLPTTKSNKQILLGLFWVSLHHISTTRIQPGPLCINTVFSYVLV